METAAGEVGNGVLDLGVGELDTFSARSMVQVLLRPDSTQMKLHHPTVLKTGTYFVAGPKDDELGPLFCAPILVKDNFDTHDLPTTGGSIALMDSIPPDDAFMVRKLRETDAIVIAKANMAEWAFSPRRTESSSYGTTANAYALDRVPAGSSGGTASGVAASFGVAGLGSDTGNSIRGPSSHLALFGIRSTIGLTKPRRRHSPRFRS